MLLDRRCDRSGMLVGCLLEPRESDRDRDLMDKGPRHWALDWRAPCWVGAVGRAVMSSSDSSFGTCVRVVLDLV